jgi:hypothetical protein
VELIYKNPRGIRVDRFDYRDLGLTVQNPAEMSALVYLDSLAPGWEVYVDGKRAPLLQAFGAFKAVLIPRGTHAVLFHYQPSRTIARWRLVHLSVIVSAACFIAALLWRRKRVRRPACASEPEVARVS